MLRNLVFVCLFCASMSNWPPISYYFSESTWIQGLKYSLWIGEWCIIMWIKKEEYDESEPSIVYRKCDNFFFLYNKCVLV